MNIGKFGNVAVTDADFLLIRRNMIRRRLWTVTKWAHTAVADGSYTAGEYRAPKNDLEANVVGSLIEATPEHENRHAPVIDVDWKCELVNSSTPGNHHLYIDCPMSWKDYEKFLKVCYEVGLIQKGYYEAAKKHKQTLVRRPGKYKPNSVKSQSPTHTIRLREIQGAIEGLLHDMGDKPEKEELTEIPF